MTDPANPLIAALEPLISRVRTDVTAVKRADGSRWTQDPLTTERLAKHLNGGPARGVCLIKPGESVTLAALLDFDSHKGEVSWPEMSAAVFRVADALSLGWGAEPLLFRSSGGRGVHLYLLWETPQDARSVRQWLAGVLRSVGLRSGTAGLVKGQVEVFPKQDEVSVGGFGNQAILPLAGASVLLAQCELSGLLVERDGALVSGDWRMSPPVPVVEAPVKPVGRPAAAGEGQAWRLALDALRNGADGSDSLGYDDWRNVVFAIHHETGGSEDGLALAQEWSSRSTKHDGAFLTERVWPYVKTGGERGEQGGSAITGGTIMSMAARMAGWTLPLDDSAFPVVVVESRGERPNGPGEANGEGARAASVREFPGETGDELPAFDREKSGAVKPTVSNAVAAVRRADVAGMRVGHDLFRDEVTVSEVGQDAWRPMTDADLVRMRIGLERLGFKSVPKELARDAVVLVAAEHEYDSAQLWLRGLEGTWDGVPRVEGFFRDYFGAGGAQGGKGAGGKEGEGGGAAYARAVSLYLWTALAGRVMDPGCQADMAPILEGGQGLRKTSAIAALVPDPQFFVEVDLELDETATARMLRGTLVGEIGELRGLHTKDQESIKKFISRRHEKWVPKYKEFSTTFARRLVFVGTTNRTDLLADETGNRRWLPLHVERADVEGIVRDRLQLWAEALELWRGRGGAGGERGVQWRDAEALAPDAHRDYEMGDAWDGPVERWLAEDDGFQASGDSSGGARALPRGTSPFTVYELAQGALGMAAKDINMLALKRIGAILCRLGYTKHTLRHEGKLAKHWVQTKHPKP